MERFQRLMNEAGEGAGGGGGGLDGGVNFHEIVNPDGTFAEGFADKLPETFQSFKGLAGKYKDFHAMLTGHLHATQEATKPKGVVIPQEDSPDDVKAAFRTAIGVPDSVDGYGIETPEGEDPEAFKESLEFLRSLDLPKSKVEKLMAFDAGRQEKIQEAAKAAFEQQLEAQEQALIKEWGADYDKNMKLAERVARTAGLEPKENAIFQNAGVVKAFAHMASLIGENSLVDSQGVGGGDGKTNKQKIDDIYNNPENPWHAAYMDPMHPNHNAANTHVQRLFTEAKRMGERI
jgi:hypothetical protein